MLVILLEALGALVLLLLIVWWTMFHGRQRGELPDEADPADADASTPADANRPEESRSPSR